ncbi:hypothetical protein G4O51_07085 [Candidatus Bathyarchaeota archaeon A05DMB-2]|jgi:hypothetical protein|nr:hypothetical protein [Candidatus Bathyarchaeota archaeon A05DMB-2]
MNESELSEVVVDFLNAVEAAAVNAKRQIAEIKGVAEKEAKAEEKRSWEPEKIPWTKAEGARGAYERYPAEGEKIESLPDYKGLLSDLKGHRNFLFREGWNYWLFPDLVTVGRKPKSKSK